MRDEEVGDGTEYVAHTVIIVRSITESGKTHTSTDGNCSRNVRESY